jgi:hypothetical protein
MPSINLYISVLQQRILLDTIDHNYNKLFVRPDYFCNFHLLLFNFQPLYYLCLD